MVQVIQIIYHRNQILTTIDDLTESQRKDFCEMVDDLILNMADNDDELKEGLEYLDEQAFHYNMSFYNLILQIYDKEELNEQLRRWNDDKKS